MPVPCRYCAALKILCFAFAYRRIAIRVQANGHLGIGERYFTALELPVHRHYSPVPMPIILDTDALYNLYSRLVQLVQPPCTIRTNGLYESYRQPIDTTKKTAAKE